MTTTDKPGGPASPGLYLVPGRRTEQLRALIVLGALLVYILGFVLLRPVLGDSASALSVLPLTIAGGFFGLRAGLFAGLIFVPLNLSLLYASGSTQWAVLVHQGGVSGAMAGLLAGVFAGLMRDVGSRIRRGEAVQAHLGAIIEATTDLVCTISPLGYVTYINSAGCELLGVEPGKDMFSMHIKDAYPAESAAWIENEVIPAAIRNGSWSGETILLGKHGKKVPVSQVFMAHYAEQGKVQYLSTVARDISERKQAQEADREQRDLAEALRDTASALNSTLDFNEVLDRILENAERVLPHDMSNIVLIDGDVARIARYRHFGQNSVEDRWLPERLTISQTPNLLHIIQTGEASIINDTQTYPGWLHLPESLWVRSHISAPIRSKGQVIGFLNLDSAIPDFYNQTHAVRLQAFADQAAIALENARLLVETERRASELAVLYEMAGDLATQQDLPDLMSMLVERAANLLNSSGGCIFLCDNRRSQLELAVIKGLDLPAGLRVDWGDGMVGRVAVTRQPMLVSKYDALANGMLPAGAEHVTAVLTVPMLYQAELIGVLLVFETIPGREFSPADARLLTLFAGQAASAVNNARLFDEARRRLAELEAVNKISTVLRTAQTVGEMLPVLLRETLAVLGTESGMIWLYNPSQDELYPAAARGMFATLNEKPIKPGEGLVGMTFQTGKHILSRDFAGDPRTASLAHDLIPPGWGGACVPIRDTRAAVGVLFAAVELPRQLIPDDAHLLNILAEMAGTAIHRASLHEQTMKQMQRLSALHSLDLTINSSMDLNFTFGILLDQVKAQLAIDAAGILLLHRHTRTLHYAAGRGFISPIYTSSSFRLGKGLCSRVVTERRMIFIPNLAEADDSQARETLFSGEGFVSYCGVPLIAKGQVKGVLEVFQRSPLTLDAEWLDFLETLAGQAAIAIENSSLFNDLQRSNLELTLAYDATIEGWSRALDLRDRETEGHTQRVADLTLRLAREMGIQDAQLVQVRRGALLHDIGKMGIPDRILLKPGPLTDEEMIIMRLHPVYAYELLSSIAFLRQALDIPYCHHERWDGGGYPRGLEAEQIPMAARIFAVVDVWDALNSDRPYRVAWPEEKARAYILEQTGKHFDPKVVDAFLSCV